MLTSPVTIFSGGLVYGTHSAPSSCSLESFRVSILFVA